MNYLVRLLLRCILKILNLKFAGRIVISNRHKNTRIHEKDRITILSEEW